MIETRIAVALVNATWQGGIVAAVAAAVLRLFGRTSASVRCAIWCAVLVAVAALPAIDVAIGRVVPLDAPAALTPLRAAPGSARIASAGSVPAIGERAQPAMSDTARAMTRPAGEILREMGRDAAAALDRAAFVLFWLWLAGAAFCGVRLAYALGILAATGRRFEPLTGDWFEGIRVRRRLRVAASEDVVVPCLVGFLEPTVVVPRPLARELGPNDLRRIVLHEAAHAQRRDHWTNLFVQLVRAALFFNPVVYYVAARIAIEREIACDDRVIDITGDRVVYAACLSEIARNVSLAGAHAVPGFFGGRAQIVVRIEELLDRAHDGSSRLGRRPLLAIAALAALALGTAHFGIPVIAATLDEPARAAVTAPLVQAAQRPAPRVAPVHATAPTERPAPREGPRAVKFIVAERLVAGGAAHPAVNVHVAMHVPPARVAPPTHVAPPARIVATRSESRSRAPQTLALAASRPGVAPASEPLPSLASNGSDANASEAAASVSNDRAPSSGGGDFIDSLAAAGYRGLSADELIRLRDHGVDGTFVAAMNAAAKRRLSPDELIELRDHGVDVLLVDTMRRTGYPVGSVNTWIQLADHGVNPEFVAAMTAALGRIGPNDLIKLRDHGVDAAFVAAMRAQIPGITVEQLVRLRDHGVDAEFVAKVRNYFANRSPSVEELIKMKDSGL